MKNNYLLFIFCLFGWISNAQIINFPDPNLKQLLIGGGATQDSSGNYIMIDVNSDNEIDQSEALLVYDLSLYYEVVNGEGLQYFTNVTSLYFSGGNPALNTLNLSTWVNLKYLFCQNTALQSISFSGQSLIGLNLAENAFTSIDLSPLASSTTITGIDLSYNALAAVDLTPLSSCPNLAFVKLSNNVLTALDWSPLSGNTNIAELIVRNNQITSFDFANINDAIKSIEFQNNALAQVDFSELSHNLIALHVEENPYDYFDTAGLGHVDTLVAGSDLLLDAKFSVYDFERASLLGHNINSIDFKNGHNESCFSIFHTCSIFMGPQFGTFRNPNQIICVDDFPYFSDEGSIIVDKSERNYWSLVINGEDDQALDPATGPHITTYCSEEPAGGFNTITGNIKYDCGNSNAAVAHVPLAFVEGGYDSTTQTDVLGNFHFYSVAANITVAPNLENPAYFNVTPPNYSYAFGSIGNNETANFCLSPNGTHDDVQLSMYPITNARPGFDSKYLLVYKNIGNQMESGTVTFNFDDAIIDLASANPNVDVQNANTLTWNFANLAPFESRSILVVLNLNSSMETPPVLIGDALTFTAQVSTTETDEVPANNQAVVHQNVVSSFDPNDKQVAEGSQVSIDNADDYLHYIIRFQNTGNATAEKVIIEDYIESDLDPTTLQVESASHPYRTTLTNGNQFEVFFEGIDLPPMTENEPLSHGYVAFKVKPRNNIALGTEITNNANIHFDFNFPIVTNTTATIYALLGAKNFNAVGNIVVYPNPAQQVLHIRNNSQESLLSVEIYNVLGQLMSRNPSGLQDQSDIDVSQLQSGNYFVRMATQSGISTQHFIKK